MAEERLQKILARAGVASRRKAEELIVAGRVRVDGRVIAELGTRVDARRARVELDGRRLEPEPLVYVLLHKPREVMSTLRDPEGRPTVADLLKDVGVRVVSVGRLDFHTSGALLFTNDGEFAHTLQHPKKSAPKVYVAKVRGVVADRDLEQWSQSIEIEGQRTRPAQVRRLRVDDDKTWLEITLKEGRNRQIHRLGEASGFPVLRLARLSQAGITTEGLRPGCWRHLTTDELVDLKRAYGVPQRVRSVPIERVGLGPKQARSKPQRAGEVRRSGGGSAPSRGAGEGRRSGGGSAPSRGGGEGRRSGGGGSAPSRGAGEGRRSGGGSAPSRGAGRPSARGSSDRAAKGAGSADRRVGVKRPRKPGGSKGR
jgi:23S rRNA pseudouridine2605 synthase